MEWSRAVGLQFESGATPKDRDGRNQVDFPWGTRYPPPRAKVGNYADKAYHANFPAENWIEGYNDGHATSSPVGSYPPNELGIHDLGGNVWEWCEDWYDAEQKNCVLRGASWNSNDRNGLLSSHRFHDAPGRRDGNYGFRCVLAPATSAPQAR